MKARGGVPGAIRTTEAAEEIVLAIGAEHPEIVGGRSIWLIIARELAPCATSLGA